MEALSWEQMVEQAVAKDELIQLTYSHPRRNGEVGYTKVTVKPIELKGERWYQFSSFCGKKVLHDNALPTEALQKMNEQMAVYRQALLQMPSADIQVRISKKGKQSCWKQPPTKRASSPAQMTHNRKKQYLLAEGIAVPFLIDLGVMTEEGKVKAQRYDKFRQINRFVEMIADMVRYLPQDRPVRIIDFGCGKSYLTFAMYYYLHQLIGLDVHIIGLDLKEDVIEHCQQLADQYGYDQLRFEVGDIGTYSEHTEVDMVVTLHACDTATDAALDKAARWGATVILSVPCCQHELFDQVQSDPLSPLLQHGILKERFSALATDALRAKWLELVGYRVQLLEFIDMEHTPKNILIRAVKAQKAPQGKEQQKLLKQYQAFRDFLNVKPALEKMGFCKELEQADL